MLRDMALNRAGLLIVTVANDPCVCSWMLPAMVYRPLQSSFTPEVLTTAAQRLISAFTKLPN